MDTKVPKKTVSKKTVPKKTVPKTSVPKTTVPKKTVKKTVPKTTVKKTVPKTTVPKKSVKRSMGGERSSILQQAINERKINAIEALPQLEQYGLYYKHLNEYIKQNILQNDTFPYSNFNLDKLKDNIYKYKSIVEKLIGACHTEESPSDADLTRNEACYLKIIDVGNDDNRQEGVVAARKGIPLKHLRNFLDTNVRERHQQKHKAWIDYMKKMEKYYDEIYTFCDIIIKTKEALLMQKTDIAVVRDIKYLKEYIEDLKEYIEKTKKDYLRHYFNAYFQDTKLNQGRARSLPAPHARKTTRKRPTSLTGPPSFTTGISSSSPTLSPPTTPSQYGKYDKDGVWTPPFTSQKDARIVYDYPPVKKSMDDDMAIVYPVVDMAKLEVLARKTKKTFTAKTP
jgi:hypothetical protein